MITQLRAALIVLSTASIMTGSFTMADDLQVRGDAVIVPVVAKLETLWEKGGFTEGAAAGPDGNMYFSDFAQPFDSGPGPDHEV